MLIYILIAIVVVLLTLLIILYFSIKPIYILYLFGIVSLLYIFYNYDLVDNITNKTKIKVLQFNIEDGGVINFEKVIEVIKLADADIVAIEEANGNMYKIAKESGYEYYDNKTQVMSHYPIINDNNSMYLFIEVEPNKVITVCNVHLPADFYGPDELKKGTNKMIVSNIEKSLRLNALRKKLEELTKLNDMPIFLMGDFNAPSHLDNKSIDWPISKVVEELGFNDSFRELYPDPHLNPGYTWWANRPQVNSWNPKPTDSHDRIDFIYVKGEIQTDKFRIIGENDVNPWPSDHRAILGEYSVTLTNAPKYIAVDHKLITVGNPIKIKYNINQNSNNTIKIIKDNKIIKEIFIGDKVTDIITLYLEPGFYDVKMNNRVTSFTVKPKNAKTELKTDKKIYNINENIIVSWKYAPGNRFDWLILLKDNKEIWNTKKSDTNGKIILNNLTKGSYKLKYLADDGYDLITETSFQIL